MFNNLVFDNKVYIFALVDKIYLLASFNSDSMLVPSQVRINQF